MGDAAMLKCFFGQKKEMAKNEINVDPGRMPKHIAIIMDGNGRWARKKGMPRAFGHRAGVESLRNVVKACSELKISVLTVYAFSTENWKRPEEEVNALMSLLVEYIYKEIEELNKNKVCIKAIGRIEQLPQECQQALDYAWNTTKNNSGLILNLALNYGGRTEIIDATRKIGEKILKNEMLPSEINEEVICDNLYTKGLPDPDLLIRPSGDYRISNFLLWQLAYTEFWLSDVMWPDFRRNTLLQAISDFQKRERRFGAIADKKNK